MITSDNIIIGAGPGGYELAAALAEKGESVTVIEKSDLGGTCLNRGCIPTKSLCASANAVLDAAFAPRLGVNVGPVSVDFDSVIARAGNVVEGLREGVGALLGKCEVVKGEAAFVAPRCVKVAGEEYTAKRIVVATGSAPSALPIPGADLAITSDEALWLDKLPASMVIIGGGVIGMEFASIFAALGSEVTVIEYCKEILPAVDPEIAKRLRTSLSRRGINILVGSAVESISEKDGLLTVEYAGKKGKASVEAEKVVMAVGRRPVVPDGFVENGGELNPRGFICVDKHMRTSIEGVYAVGDVNGLLMLAHAAYAQGRVVLHDNSGLFEKNMVPSVVFTSPELAAVGPSAAELTEYGTPFHVVKRSFQSNGKACADGHPDGVVKMLVNDDDNTILSVTILGHHAADLIAEATILVAERIPLDQVASRFIHAHPTLSEILA